jgi:aryl sulfotransferase
MALVRYRNAAQDNSRWNEFEPRVGDIVISTPAKCGTSWMQMMCALLIFQEPVFEQPLTDLSPWFDSRIEALDPLLAGLKDQRHRRFIKTHTPLDGLPAYEGVTYVGLGRDPRDVAISWDHHLFVNADVERVVALHTNARAVEAAAGRLDDSDSLQPPDTPPPDSLLDRVTLWIDDDTPVTESLSSLRLVVHHVSTFTERERNTNVALFHYGDLHRDLPAQMHRLADVLEIRVPESKFDGLVAAARFEAMRARAHDLAPEANKGIWKDTESFFHSGEIGQWRDLLDETQLQHYTQRIQSLADPSLVAWLHNDPPGDKAIST